ncbi:hypothetical protein HanPSC8_Chr09g0360171 [Helianthus annuus]|nr:hypothetical protein HanPSC8_Chr09g0360171 [Helianthus annuus]
MRVPAVYYLFVLGPVGFGTRQHKENSHGLRFSDFGLAGMEIKMVVV